MTNIGIDQVLNRLSVKFNRIFYDRDFVGSVGEDLQTIIDNQNKRCVLLFPSLSQNYLRVVRYQAKLCDLAVISLGSGTTKSIGVCHKKYFVGEQVKKEKLVVEQMADNGLCLKKKRPPIQLYVPPAQRKSRISGEEKGKPCRDDVKKTSSHKEKRLAVERTKSNGSNSICVCYCPSDIEAFVPPYQNCVCLCTQMMLFKNLLPYAKFSLPVRLHCPNACRMRLDNDTLLFVNDGNRERKHFVTHLSKVDRRLRKCPLVYRPAFDAEEHVSSPSSNCCLYENDLFLSVGNTCNYYCNLEFKLSIEDIDLEESLIYSSADVLVANYVKDAERRIACPTRRKNDDCDLENILNDLKLIEPVNNCDTETVNVNKSIENKQETHHVIVLEPQKEEHKVESKNVRTKPRKGKHDIEKEIMRKARQNINRKSRPIIKYAGDDDDTLKIGKGDDINNWEDLFDEDGELQEDIFNEIAQKVGPDVTIIKATEDYSAYASKQLEELEHMVELYDFPATFDTNDIISAFSTLNSDSMYVKWVDDTHALLVLGSCTQAQNAIKLSSSLIKVRPMSAASNMALQKANQSDLRPAMKRPQTNLQTARRLITSHLGTKSRVSQEQSAKEREDLRMAKELKKQAKKNERDAWEGSLRSTLS